MAVAIQKSNNPQAFVDFELAGWDESIGGYERAFGAVAGQTVQPMLDAAKVQTGMRVLDVCCGPAMLGNGAIARGAAVTGLDFSQEAVDLAKRLVPAGQFQRGDAQELPFPDDSFDAVVCGYGVMHLPEPARAMHEMVRVVQPGGRVAISVWDSTTPDNGFGLIYAAVRAHGRMDVSLPHGPDFFQFGTLDKMGAALTEIGLADVRSVLVGQHWHVESAAHILDVMRGGTVRARALLAAQSEDATTKIRQFIDGVLARYPAVGGGFNVPLPAVVGSGMKH